MRQEEADREDIGRDHLPADIPDEFEFGEDEGDADTGGPSLVDDVLALVEDGKTYAEAELAFQKSRAGFTANRVKKAVGFGAAAFGVLHLALIAIAVGAVLALIPLVGAWLATLIVGGGLIVAGVLLLRGLRSQIEDIRSAFDEGVK